MTPWVSLIIPLKSRSSSFDIPPTYSGNRNPTNLTGNCDGKTGSAASFSADYTDYLARSFETQTYVYEQASGWIYWYAVPRVAFGCLGLIRVCIGCGYA